MLTDVILYVRMANVDRKEIVSTQSQPISPMTDGEWRRLAGSGPKGSYLRVEGRGSSLVISRIIKATPKPKA